MLVIQYVLVNSNVGDNGLTDDVLLHKIRSKVQKKSDIASVPCS